MRRWVEPCLAVLLCLPAALPLLVPGYLDTHAYGDSPYLLLRLFEIDRNVRDGLWYSRWAPDFAFGYGYPFFNYYAPLPYYVAEAFHLAGLDLVAALQATHWMALLGSGLSMYLLAASLWGRRAGLLASVVYVYAPFHLVNIYLRGDALGEFAAYALMPLVLWAFWHLVRRPSGGTVAIGAVLYGSLVLTHNVTALTFTPLLIAFSLAAWLLGSERRRPGDPDLTPCPLTLNSRLRRPSRCGEGEPTMDKHLRSPLRAGEGTEPALSAAKGVRSGLRAGTSPAPTSDQGRAGACPLPQPRKEKARRWTGLAAGGAALLLGLGLSAFFWLPALMEQGYVQMQYVTTGYFDFRNHFLPLDRLFSFDLAFNYGHDGRPLDGLPFRGGLGQAAVLLLAGVALLWASWRWWRQPGERRAWDGLAYGWLVLAAAAVLLWLMTPASIGIWEAAPLLKWAQFPWRLLLLLGLLSGLLGGAMLHTLRRHRRLAEAAWLGLAGLSIISATWSLWPEHIALSGAEFGRAQVFAYEYLSNSIGSTVRQEYLPVQVKERPWSSDLVLSYPEATARGAWTLEGDGRLETIRDQSTYRELAVGGPTTVVLHSYYFPGWQATLDGQPVEVAAEPGTGLLRVEVPAGLHRLVVQMAETPLRQTADLLSQVVLLAILALAIAGLLRGQPSSPATLPSGAESPASPRWTVAGAALLLAAALLPWPHWGSFAAAYRPSELPPGLPPLRTIASDVHSPLPHRHPAGTDYGPWRWLGYQLSDDQPAAGKELRLSVYWQAQAADAPPVTVRARLIHPNDYLRQEDRTLSLSEAPIAVADGIGRSDHILNLAAGTPPGLYQIELQPVGPSGSLPLLASTGVPTDRTLLLGPLAVRRGPSPSIWPGEPVRLEWDGKMRLDSRHILSATTERVQVEVHWQALAPMAEPYRLSLRLVDEEGHRWGQQDSQPLDGAYPTTLWQPGEAVTERHDLRPLPGTPPGRYQLELRVYSLATGKELEVRPTGGATGRLGPIELALAGGSRRAVEVPRPMIRRLADGLELMGTAPLAAEARPGEALEVGLFWRATTALSADYQAVLELRGPGGEPWGERRVPLAGTDYPPRRWKPGETLRAQHRLRLRPEAGPGTATLLVSVADPAGESRSEPVEIGQVQVPARQRNYAPPSMQHNSGVALGEKARLLGFDLERSSARPGETLPVALYWQGMAPMDASYTVFLQLLGADGRLYGQRDSLPGGGQLPTTGWAPGEVIADRYELPVAQDAPPGEYRLIAGMYDAATGRRLPVAGEDGWQSGDYVVLGTIMLARR